MHGAGEAAGCRAFLAVADKLGACTASEQSAFVGLLTRVLATYLESGFRGDKRVPSPKADGIDWPLALELADRAGAMQATDDWRRVQEIVWEHLEALRRRREAHPEALHQLALRLELVNPASAEPASK